MAVAIILILLVIILAWLNATKKPSNYPPGPRRWPILGNILSLRGRPLHFIARDLSEKYGNIMGLYVGSHPLIIISGLAEVKEASSKEELSGRPVTELALEIGNGLIRGLIFSQGNLWREQRRFTLRHLRDLGFGKRSMEGLIHEEVNSLIVEVGRMAGTNWEQSVELHNMLGASGINVLWHVMAGRRYAHDDPKLKQLTGLIKELLTITDASGGIANNFPFLTRYLPFLTEKKKILAVRKNIIDFLKEDIVRHKATLDADSPRDFIDIYLIEMNEHIKEGKDSSFTERCLTEVCRDLFMAGTDTTFNSITFALVYMVRYPHVQRKVQEELDNVVGQERLPGLQDRPSLSYTEATIMEALRVSSVVPMGVPHAPLMTCKADVPFRGYVIPKNARIAMNLAQIHMDPKIWGDPENFRPERFLNEEGKLIKQDALVPFGLGKRQCLGEALARNNLFLFFAGILQRFTLSVPKGEEPPSVEPTGGFTLAPRNSRAKITPRF
ncbi:methyl farnesoate epoxidase-like [Neocloeon triangulifer]|uniref:methyl farnesoate epoxidase-like n=1 Tax=Neocloeon triangulifer TaxID=2078957 RepID=UPI00286F120B|nr:methyl farnesoate epoxidase-like [Neocloeon triangulifer]